MDKAKEMLNDRFESLDYENAKDDVISFIKDKSSLDIWSGRFFKEITKELQED